MINFFFCLKLGKCFDVSFAFFLYDSPPEKKRSRYAKGSLAVKLSEVINMQLLPIISILYQADR